MIKLNNRSWLWWLLLVVAIPSFISLLREGFFPIHDDLPVVRQYAMEECIRDGQVPCRWTKELGNGYGYPLMNFYPPLPYLAGLLPRAMGLSYVDTVKLLFILALVVSVGFMARLGRVFWGDWGGAVAAIFYLYGPYHAVDLYVRGDLNELWAMAFLPAALWFGYEVIKRADDRNAVKLGLAVAAIVLSHLGMALIMIPVVGAWIVMWSFLFGLGRLRMVVFPILLSIGVAVGSSAFFSLPVVYEQKYVHVESLIIGYFNFLAHFVDIGQLFLSRFWGYGSSVFGPNDGLSFQVGIGHWLVVLVVLLGIIFGRKDKMRIAAFGFTGIVLAGALFMSHWRSTFVWLRVPKLAFLQFPWRFLALVIFSTSFIAGGLVSVFREKQRGWVFAVAVVANLILYGIYFQPLAWFADRSDATQFSGAVWQREIVAGIFDYLPVWSKVPPGRMAASDGLLIGNNFMEVKAATKTSNRQVFSIVNGSGRVVTLVVNTLYYPGWVGWVNGQKQQVGVTKGDLGLITVSVPPGVNEIEIRLGETLMRELADGFSLVTMVGLVWFWRRLGRVGG